MATVFDSKERGYLGPAGANESVYSWLDRSGSDDAVAARAQLERLYAQFDDPDGKLLRNLRTADGSGADNMYHAALASLVLYDRLKAAGFAITTDEAIGGHERRPDMQLHRADVGAVTVEVTTYCQKEEWTERDWRLGRMTDAINHGVKSPYFTLSVQVESDLPAHFDHVPVVDAIKAELDRLGDPGSDASSADRPWQVIYVTAGTAVVEVSFIPMNYQRRGKWQEPDHRTIDIYPGRGGLVGTERRLRNKLRNKHPSRYPERYSFDRPFVIAVAATDLFLDIKSVIGALWGDEKIALPADPDHAHEARLFRDHKGHFCLGANGPRNARVSGVLLAHKLTMEPFRPGSLELDYYDNPYAQHRLDGRVLGATRVFGVVEADDRQYRLDWLS